MRDAPGLVPARRRSSRWATRNGPDSGRFASGDLEKIAEAAEVVGYPLLVKAAGGGGGIGMQLVNDPTGLVKAVESTQALAQRAFGDGTVYFEHYVTRARHIEIQVFGFGDGRVVHMFERECSVQRRFQKIIEEAPAPGLDAAMLANMTSAAIALAAQERYEGAGTVEFVFDDDAKKFYFLEMNTRIQVEHPVTEMTTGLDLVSLQLRQARGEDLSALTQKTIQRKGHAIECRLYAENPNKNFMPAPGRLEVFQLPAAQGNRRIDTGVRAGDQITQFYDPMIAKIICGGGNRGEAIARTVETLELVRIDGLKTNLQFLTRVLRHPTFSAGELHTHFVEVYKGDLLRT
jgi:3-methylcrotonyl-CoA carboxylase alpha subunit